MRRDKNKKSQFNEGSNVFDVQCLALCHQEITYATQRLAVELSILKSMASRSAMVKGGRVNG
jgi:hypothetical protein